MLRPRRDRDHVKVVSRPSEDQDQDQSEDQDRSEDQDQSGDQDRSPENVAAPLAVGSVAGH